MGNVTSPLAPILNSQGYAVLDGALATELEQRGADLNDPLWSAKVLLESPEMIQAVHRDYLLAGADIITTASYQATIEGFMAKGLSRSRAEILIARSVEIATNVRDQYWSDSGLERDRHKPLVAASIGPYGAYLADGSEYRGDYDLSIQALRTFHRSRVAILSRTNADILAFETIPSLLEGRAILRLLAEFPSMYAWLAFSCRNGYQTVHGESISECAALAEETSQIAAIGVNCTAPGYIASLIDQIRIATNKPIIVYPNSGEAWDAAGGRWQENTLETASLSVAAAQWYSSGARIIGGCCRTTPDDIAQIRKSLAKQL